MSDHGILPDKALTPAERAVKYTLDVLQTRPELAWFLVDTETLSQLLSAEAYRMGLSTEEESEYRAAYVLDLDRSDPEQCRHCGERLECPRCDREEA